MRFMLLMIPKGYEQAAPEAMPPVEAVREMMTYNQSLADAGILISCEGLHPPAMGARVTWPAGKPVITDGPFSEAKEVLGGYWIIRVDSLEEAVAWAARCPGDANATIEVRQVQEMDDFPEDLREAAAGFEAMQTGGA
jgi:hypothetical protein